MSALLWTDASARSLNVARLLNHRQGTQASPVRAAGPERGVDWSAFGTLVPVLAGSSGAGASVLATALVDVLGRAGRCAMLIDPVEPSRSGLGAAASPGPFAPAGEGVRVRWSWREHALLAQLETESNPLAPIPVLAPRAWLPPYGPLHVTLVDLGRDWSAPPPSGDPCAGLAGWLRAGRPGDQAQPRPLLVVRATRPSLAAAETALARVDPWLRGGELIGPVQLVVMACWKPRWPRGVIGAAGARVAPLLEDAVFIPYDPKVAVGGVSEQATPARVAAAVAALIERIDLFLPSNSSPRAPRGRAGKGRRSCSP
jgi:hypothetical protein